MARMVLAEAISALAQQGSGDQGRTLLMSCTWSQAETWDRNLGSLYEIRGKSLQPASQEQSAGVASIWTIIWFLEHQL